MTQSGEPTNRKYRTLRHSKIFDAQREELNKKFDADGAIEVTEWLVCQNPYKYPLIENGYRVAETTESIQCPALYILFLVVDDDLIKMCFVEEQTIEGLDEGIYW